MADLLKKHLKELSNFEKQRIFWLRISGFVAVATLLIIADWSYVRSNQLTWAVVSAGLIISVAWWYWTMMFIRRLLTHKTIEAEILVELVRDIKDIKEDVKKLDTKA